MNNSYFIQLIPWLILSGIFLYREWCHNRERRALVDRILVQANSPPIWPDTAPPHHTSQTKDHPSSALKFYQRLDAMTRGEKVE